MKSGLSPLKIALILFAITAMFPTIFSPTVSAQGVLVPDHEHGDSWRLPRHHPHRPRPVRRPPQSYKIKEISINARIEDQVARTQVSQTFVNTGSRQMQVSFVFPLPYDGAVDRLTFLVDGKEYEAKLLRKEEARKIYEGYVRRMQDPALLEWVGTGMFKTSVFPVPPGKARTVTLKYTQLLKKDLKLTDYLFPLSTAKYSAGPIDKLSFNIAISSSSKIKSVYSPTHAVDIQRSDDKHAVVKYTVKNQIPSTDFRLFFDQVDGAIGASVLSYWPESEQNGYYLLLASPEIKSDQVQKQSKNIIFVIDRSGSMNGKKMDQAKEALKFTINNLREGDLFNIIAYDSSVEPFKPELQRFTEDSRKEAIGFVNGIFAGGSTDIDGALTQALSMIHDGSLPNYIVFLTDGKPTSGEVKERAIAANAKKNNKFNARLINFGVGYKVNSRLIDRLARDNRGQSEYVRPDEDIEVHVSRLYQKIAAPVLVDAKIDVEFDTVKTENGKPTNRVYPKEIFDIFKGQQVVQVGRYNTSGAAKIKISGKLNNNTTEFAFPANFNGKSNNEAYAFVEKLWASRRIGEIIDQLDLNGHNRELVEELVSLSLTHGIITPYTSYIADDQASPNDLANAVRNNAMAGRRLEALNTLEGKSGIGQRAAKRIYSASPQIVKNNSQSLQKALKDAAESSPSAGAGFGGGSGGGGASAPGRGGAIQSNRAFGKPNSGGKFAEKSEGKDGVISGNKYSAYRRGKTLIASNAREVDLKKEKDNIKDVTRYSTEYFALVKANSKAENELLAMQAEDEELIIKLRGVIYRIK